MTNATATRTAVMCRGVTKVFGEGDFAVQALRGIDLDVMLGELTLLVGPSGCGKTTLISVIAGILNRTAGECRVLGEDTSALPDRARAAWRGRNVGFVFQSLNLVPTLTAAENVAIPLLILGTDHRTALAKAAVMLERVGIGNRARALPAQLSGGQQQRIAIARALVHEPRLLVCDEPTSALDHETGHKVMELLKEVAAGPERALIVVTHDSRIFSFADRIAHMDDGHVERIETPSRS
ncbi:MAG: ABC transporter ATP-binding protein [Planctomycetota bacterium]|nr:ABC transporter ATP-binding protein [Planctomycetota bacterium]